jgi:arabinan endo-1,5-alpha-L-arabinosidase
MNVARQGGFGRQQPQEAPKPIACQTLDEVKGTWPEGDIAVRCSDYMFRPWQRWSVTPVPQKGGNICGPLYEIKIEGTNRALTATENLQLTSREYTGDENQLWFIEQLTDGTYRIVPFSIPGMQKDQVKRYCIYSAGDSTPTLALYDFSSDNSKWNFRTH